MPKPNMPLNQLSKTHLQLSITLNSPRITPFKIMKAMKTLLIPPKLISFQLNHKTNLAEKPYSLTSMKHWYTAQSLN